MKKETAFQKDVKDELERRFPGCYILKNDPTLKRGIPDLTVLYKDRWAMLEVKRSKDAPHQPNQDYHVQKLGEMSFSAFIFPENKAEVLDELESYFSS